MRSMRLRQATGFNIREGSTNRGQLIASFVRFNRLYIGNRELEFRGKQEYDPTAVAPEVKQSVIKEAFGEVDPKKFPPFKDPAMQARIEKIGNSLIPAYQQALPDSDPAKIHFRFQLIDTKLFSDGLTLPNGIILVPRQVVERMQNDSQLATVLADDMAGALERIEYRYMSALNMTAAGVLATDATMLLAAASGPARNRGRSHPRRGSRKNGATDRARQHRDVARRRI